MFDNSTSIFLWKVRQLLKKKAIEKIERENAKALSGHIERYVGQVVWKPNEKGYLVLHYRTESGEYFPYVFKGKNTVYQPIRNKGKRVRIKPLSDKEVFYYYHGYFVSNFGRCYSTLYNKFLIPYSIGKGNSNKLHEAYKLHINCIPIVVRISNLVAGIFDYGYSKRYNTSVDLNDCQVHHINENPKDNRDDNLIILTPKDHTAVHRAIRKGVNLSTKELIEKYLIELRESEGAA